LTSKVVADIDVILWTVGLSQQKKIEKVGDDSEIMTSMTAVATVLCKFPHHIPEEFF
jgi:hypothetical protein